MKTALRLRPTFLPLTLLLFVCPCARAYLVGPPDGLDKMTTNADLVCKVKVTGFVPIANAWFKEIQGFELRGATMEIISVLKGNPTSKLITFQHYTTGPKPFFFYSPQHYDLETNRTYLIFATEAGGAGEYRQIRSSHTTKSDEGVMRTLDGRPLIGLSVKDAHLFELGLLLLDSIPSNSLYAIQQLDSLSKRCGRDWGQTDDFKRPAVLQVLQPLCTHTNEQVAVSALKCFQVRTGCEALILPHTDALIQIANSAPSIPRRVAAIDAFAGMKLPAVSNLLSRWLRDDAAEVRTHASLLLADFPSEFAESNLRELATDNSSKVRASVADAIGNGKFTRLLPTLEKLLAEKGDVHSSAAAALLKFEANQVRDILIANLNDEIGRSGYLCKLAEKDPGPWMNKLAAEMEARRTRIQKEVEESGVEPKANYFRGRMALAGTYFQIWNIMHEHLLKLPAQAFADGKQDRYLDVLENAGNSGSREPVAIYELYRMKELHERAAKFRKQNETEFAVYSINQFFDRVDARYTNTNAR